MKKIKIKNLIIENFKGVSSLEVTFGDSTEIRGANATGKTTVFDALTWLLFDRDSLGSAKFEIRRLDSAGNKIHNEIISVTGVFDVDGKEVVLKKSQRENWVKKRGSAVAELQGNKNEFGIDGFPKFAKEYQTFISDMIGDDLFQMITNPMHFPSMDWKKQREILMRLLQEISDVEIAKEAGVESIIPDLEKASSLDDIQKKYRKALSEWKQKQAELPIRIDEVAKQKVEVDVEALRTEKVSVEKELAEIASKFTALQNAVTDRRNLETQIMEMKFEQAKIEKDYNSANQKRREMISKDLDSASASLITLRGDLRIAEAKISADKDLMERINKDGVSVNDKYLAIAKETFKSGTEVCPTCGQKLPEDAVKRSEQTFKDDKARRMADIREKADNLKAEKSACEDRIKKSETEVKNIKYEIMDMEERVSDLKAKLDAVPSDVDGKDIPEWMEIQNGIDSRQDILNQPLPYDADALKSVENAFRTKIMRINDALGQTARNADIDKRIEELKTEQLDTAQAVVDAERMLFTLEEFVRFKMEKVSSLINDKFADVEWKLFENQINGGLRECCELTVNGVPYGSLNNGNRITAGLNIICTLQKFFGVEAPVFVDNAEAISSGNFPKMDCQVVKLIVTDDKVLEIK